MLVDSDLENSSASPCYVHFLVTIMLTVSS